MENDFYLKNLTHGTDKIEPNTSRKDVTIASAHTSDIIGSSLVG